ncbi:MAG TPA: hypothetical protein VEL03_17585 [Streptosporangiaceae bacterium]|nr:hypothetical protein [Streptosporangiaceae bacterium]
MSQPDDPDAVTQPIELLRSLRQHRQVPLLRAKSRPPDQPPADRPGLVRGAARSLLVTPWFAAGTGFVIAAGLWIYSPHTVLRFPPNAQNETPCLPVSCGPQTSGQDGGSLAIQTPGVAIGSAQSGKGHGKPDVAGKSPIAGLRFYFRVTGQQNNSFSAVITVSGKDVPSSWRLDFSMPGVQINYVSGADWQPTASGGGGTASSPPGQFGGSGNGGYGGGPSPGTLIQFMLGGTGTPSMPATCEFDGYACAFR